MIVALATAIGATFVAGVVIHRELRISRLIALVGPSAITIAICTVLLLMGAPVENAAYLGAIGAICAAIAVIDARKLIIPDALVAALAFIACFAPFCPAPLHQLLGAVVMGVVFVGVRTLYFLARRAEGLGLGDVKLAIVSGALVGAETALLATALAAVATAAWVVVARRDDLQDQGAPGLVRVEAPLGVGLAGALLVACLAPVSIT
jgi:leader peptidase (prepilin peptidase) / N-methyltransferase